MTVRRFRWIFATLLGLMFVLSLFFPEGPQTIGASVVWANGRYAFSGGTQPWALGLAAVILAAFVLLMGAKVSESAAPLPGLMRRLVAFCLDFCFAMLMLTPVIGVVPMTAEWRNSGSFAWSFERTAQTASDLPLTFLSLALLVPGLLFYFAIPLVMRRPSPGACIAGYQVVADEGCTITLRAALLRSLVGYFALCACWVAPFFGRGKKAGKFWLDKVFRTRAVIVN
jgi:hypothetical protein